MRLADLNMLLGGQVAGREDRGRGLMRCERQQDLVSRTS